MDPPMFTACVFFPQTTYGSTSVHCMCVLIHKPHMDPLESLHVCSFHKPHMDQPLESLHVCYFHKPHMDQPVSLHVCSFHKSHMDPLESLLVCSYTKTSTRVIACVFFPQTTYGSTSVHCMCVLSTDHIWINQWSLHVCYFPKTHIDPPESLFVCSCLLYTSPSPRD